MDSEAIYKDVQALASILQVQYPPKKKRVVISQETKIIVNSAVGLSGLTPLMLAAKIGTEDSVSLLLMCGADVYVKTKEGKSALDYAVCRPHAEIAYLLFISDKNVKDRDTEFQSLLRENPKLTEIFLERDSVHRRLVQGKVDSEMRKAFGEAGDTRYYVNSKGQSALYNACVNLKYDSWAFLKSLRFDYFSTEERKEMREVEIDARDMFQRALKVYVFKVEGFHVSKMVSKVTEFRGDVGEKDDALRNKIEGFFRHLDDHEYTSMLLRVLQDEIIDVTFDFHATAVRNMCAAFSEGDHGLTDFQRMTVFAAAEENEHFSYSVVVSNLAHELAHMALMVVFQNGGLPYKAGDEALREEYQDIVRAVLSDERINECDDIIRRVKGYDAFLYGHELIVRVPEMVAKYRRQENDGDQEDGIEKLESQAQELLDYYEEHVLPEFQQYIEKMLTKKKITTRELLEHQKFLTVHLNERVKLKDDIGDPEVFVHKELRVVTVSDLKLGSSHLSAHFNKIGQSILFVDYSLYVQCRKMFVNALRNREIDTLAVIWDKSEKAKICFSKWCTEICLIHEFGELAGSVVLLVEKKWPFRKKLNVMEYSWEDLSDGTKSFLLDRKLNFGGKKCQLKGLIETVAGGEDIEKVAEEILDSSNISILLQGDNVKIGNKTCWSIGDQDNQFFMNHPECIIPRSLRLKFVNFDIGTLERIKEDLFFVGNADVQDMQSVGFEAEQLCIWDLSGHHGDERCILVDRTYDLRDDYDIFAEIVDTFKKTRMTSTNVKRFNNIHFLKLNRRRFFHLDSVKCGERSSAEETEDEILENSYADMDPMDEFENEGSLVISDEPGSGKSIFVNDFAKKLKDRYPETWIEVVDLSICEYQQHLKTFPEHESPSYKNTENVQELLYALVKGENSSIERTMFNLFCHQRNKLVVFFDGFDEICPQFKEVVTCLLMAIKSTTAVKVCVTTRLHEACDLEKCLNTISYQLMPFSEEEQISFLIRYWDALVKDLPSDGREEKIKSIRFGMETWLERERNESVYSDSPNQEEPPSETVVALTSDDTEINFKPVADKLIKDENFFVEGDDKFTKTPLNVQMMASVLFHESFTTGKTMRLAHLYQRFVDIKINIYCREKVRTPENVQSIMASSMIKKYAVKTLVKISANLFHDESAYKLKNSDIEEAVNIGLITLKRGVHIFVHRTFGEFFYSKWLMRKTNKVDITKFWLERLLFEDGLSRVLEFIEGNLQSLYDETRLSNDLGEEREISILNPSGYTDETLVMKRLHPCIYASIFNCHPNILHHLVDSFGERVPTLFFREPDVKDWGNWQNTRLSESFKLLHMSYNALTFCERCIDTQKPSTSIDYIKILTKMLHFIENFGMTEEMRMLISQNGLWWVWNFKIEFFQNIKVTYCFEVVTFFLKNKEIFKDVLKEELYIQRSALQFAGLAYCSLDCLKMLTDAMLDGEWEKALLEGECLFRVLLYASSFYGADKYREMWEYFEGRLGEGEGRLILFQRKDEWGVNAFLSAMLNKNPSVMGAIWELGESLMGRDGAKKWLVGFFDGVPTRIAELLWLTPGFLSFLVELLSKEILSEEEIYQLFLSKDDGGKFYFLRFYRRDLPILLIPFHNFLIQNLKSKAKDVLEIVENIYFDMLVCVINEASANPSTSMRAAFNGFERVYSPVDRSLVMYKYKVNERGLLLDYFVQSRREVNVSHCIVFQAMFNQQLLFESKILGRDNLFDRITRSGSMRGSCGHRNKKFMHVIVKHTNELLTYKACSTLLPYLTKTEVTDFLFSVDDKRGETAFHVAARCDRLKSFLVLYDLARIMLEEDSLWQVHSQVDKEGKAVQDWFKEETNYDIRKLLHVMQKKEFLTALDI